MAKSEYKEQAFKELYTRYSTKMYAYCRRILFDGAAAEDIFQEVFISLLKDAENGKEIKSLPAYLLTVAKNLSLNHHRNYKRYVDIDSLELKDESKEDNGELSEIMNRALELLPENYRDAIVLHNYMGFSYEEIANLRNISLSDVKNFISRGKQKLKVILQPYFEYKQ